MSSTLSESDSDAPPKAEASFALMTAIFTGFNGLEKESVRIFRGWDVSNVVEELWQMADDNPLDPDTTYNIEVVAAFADGKRFTITDDESPGVSTRMQAV
ncbi:hypothetical protein H4R18_003683 [Coemansia javaensis]|uniref:Uncharacterized protein n=1 Tax=Coemansia javaensis TaxID=2761396 RepID=A0A9W8H8D6_9FUNG|nr:hypothetical protein H4R18_003683 [Coemansia javaensis]